ncbi:hypothetical protein ACPV5T_19035 [Vibrio astriarenae]
MKWMLIILQSMFLLGCVGQSPHSKYSGEQHLLDNVDASSDGYFLEYSESVKDKPNVVKAREYLSMGMALSKTVCFKYLDDLEAYQNNTNFTQSEIGVLAVLATGVMGINGASSDSFSRLALGTAALNSSVDLYRNHYLLGPDSDVIIGMVKRAMDLAEVDIKESRNPPNNFIEAYELLTSYSIICSDSEIRRLVRSSVEKANLIVDSEQKDSSQKEALDDIALKFNRPGLANEQYVGLYWLVREYPTDTESRSIISFLLGEELEKEVQAKEMEELLAIKRLFEKSGSAAASYQNAIDYRKSALRAHENEKDKNNLIESDIEKRKRIMNSTKSYTGLSDKYIEDLANSRDDRELDELVINEVNEKFIDMASVAGPTIASSGSVRVIVD